MKDANDLARGISGRLKNRLNLIGHNCSDTVEPQPHPNPVSSDKLKPPVDRAAIVTNNRVYVRAVIT